MHEMQEREERNGLPAYQSSWENAASILVRQLHEGVLQGVSVGETQEIRTCPIDKFIGRHAPGWRSMGTGPGQILVGFETPRPSNANGTGGNTPPSHVPRRACLLNLSFFLPNVDDFSRTGLGGEFFGTILAWWGEANREFALPHLVDAKARFALH